MRREQTRRNRLWKRRKIVTHRTIAISLLKHDIFGLQDSTSWGMQGYKCLLVLSIPKMDAFEQFHIKFAPFFIRYVDMGSAAKDSQMCD